MGTSAEKSLGSGRTIAISGSSAVFGALAATYAQRGHLYLVPAGSYQDLAAILLGAVGVIVAIFGGVLAIAAFWGFAQMKQEAVRSACERAIPAASNAAIEHLKQEIGTGEIRTYISAEVERLFEEELNSARMARRIEARVDKMVLGNSEEDQLLELEEQEEDDQ
jgi:hypothetical protein